MARQIFIVFALIVASSAQELCCGPNESVAECGRICEPSCTNPKPEVCPAIACSNATSNCRCNEGFVRNTDSQQCVRLDECPCDNYKCGANESVNICGTLCEPSCKNPKPEFCPTVECSEATTNCRCNEGFVRDDISKECIPFDNCPCETWNCGPNESVDKCGTLCEPSCTNPKPEICATVECSDATTNCRCNEGFVRDEASQECVPLDKCPCDNCGDHESINRCGKLCEPSCTNPNPRICPKIACTNFTTDCRCDEGYYRDAVTSLCVPFDKCTVCGPNEQLGNCGRLCEGNCTHPEPSVQCAATTCSGNGCQCKDGFVRDPISDRCIPQSECPPKVCKPFEIYAACGTTCEGTCESPWLPEICTRIRCAIQDCRCDLDSGYVRDETTGECVAIRQCGSRCPRNSEARVCGSICEPTCKNPIERLCKIDPSVCRVDCRCSRGFVRDEKSNECIRPENCC